MCIGSHAVVLPDVLTLSLLVPQPQMRSRMSGQERVTDPAGGVPVSCLFLQVPQVIVDSRV